MERGLILLSAALMVFVAPGVKGTAHLSFANNTEVNITRAGCRVSKLCVETPNDCDPAGTGNMCLFGSVAGGSPQTPNGTDLFIQVRGNSAGYVALGLTVNASEGTTMLFICARNSSDNGTFLFLTMQRNNTNAELTPSERRVTEIRGMAKDNVIQCEYKVPNVNATNTRSDPGTTFTILLGNGSFDGNTPGQFAISLNSGPLNLIDPGNTPTPTPTMISNTTMASNTTTASGAACLFHSHVVPVLLSVLTLSTMQRT